MNEIRFPVEGKVISSSYQQSIIKVKTAVAYGPIRGSSYGKDAEVFKAPFDGLN